MTESSAVLTAQPKADSGCERLVQLILFFSALALGTVKDHAEY